MFYEFKIKDEFYDKYLEFYIERFVYTSIDIEEDKEPEKLRKKKINLLNAFKFSLDSEKEILDVWDIRDLGDLVNVEDNVPEGFRRIIVGAGKYATFQPVLPREIISRLYTLLDNYKNIWCDLDVFEKEARFHIDFMRIHPFEDGNKRTAKTLLNRNLIYHDRAPVIIQEEDNEVYYNFINNRDYSGFAKFLENRSMSELTNMVALYKMLNSVPVDVNGDSIIKAK